jgi:hypothetical protein
MQKVLVVRTPYCFYNKTNLKILVKITQMENGEEKERFMIKPGEIRPLD